MRVFIELINKVPTLVVVFFYQYFWFAKSFDYGLRFDSRFIILRVRRVKGSAST